MAIETLVSDLNRQKTSGADLSHPARAGEEVSLLDLLIVLAERKRLILWITAAFAIAAVLVALLLPKNYTATVTLLPPQQNSSVSSQLAAQLGSLGGIVQMAGGGGSLLKSPNDMYVAMLKSRTVADAMVSRFGLMQEYRKKYLSDAREAFEKRTSVDGSGKDGLIHISVEDHDPNRAAALANGYVDQFRELSKSLAITEAQQRRLFFEDQWKQANQNLAEAEESLKETEQKTGLIQLDSQARALIESAAALRAQIAAKEVQIQGMQTYATGENAQLIEAEQELAGLRAQLAKLGGTSDNSDSIIVPKGKMTAAGMEYARRLRDVKYYETIFDILARQFELAKLDEAKEGAIIQVVDPAVPPDKKSSPRRGLIVIVTTILGFLAGLITALLSAGLQWMKLDPGTRGKFALLRDQMWKHS
jgi:tyrosine-protein kinase Etk/Wzc